MNVKFVRMYAAVCIALAVAGCDTRNEREPDTPQQQWIRVQNDFEVIRLIDSGHDKKASITFKRLADHDVIGDRTILNDLASGKTNNVRATLNKMIDGWIIQEACHSQHPPLTVLLDSPERLRFLANLGVYREEHPNLPFDAEVDKRVAEILVQAQRRVAARDGKAQDSLPDRLLAVTIDQIRVTGPDEDAAQFIAMAPFSWEKRNEIAQVTVPYLTNQLPAKAAGALAVLYRLRAYRPMNDIIGAGGSAWEQKDKPAPFWSELDRAVLAGVPHYHTLNDPRVFHNLSLYLGVVPSADSSTELLRIATETAAKEQALICLAWHRDPKDMDSLLPFMLTESVAAWNLPYHFRNSYGQAARPYLRRALEQAQSPVIRQRIAYELVHMRVPEGFLYLERVARANPEPETPTSPKPLEGIRQFAIDYLNLPKDSVTPAAIAAHIAKKEQELCTIKSQPEGVSNLAQEVTPHKLGEPQR